MGPPGRGVGVIRAVVTAPALGAGEGGGGDGAGHGAWECRACLRAFSLKMLGMITQRPNGPEKTGVQR